jgi:pyridoxamine 5'-phosphate oxidase
MKSISDLRKSYERAELDESASQADPLQQFDRWLKEAISSEVPEPNAMTLATVGSDLRPSTRVVLIKDYDARGIVWYTNYESRKGRELAGNPYAALQFHWVELERVVRIEGVVETVSAEDSDAYFNSRPLDSRIGAWASPQSQVIPGRSVLVANAARYAAQFLLNPPRPTHWGGYRLKPDNWQFWQGRKSRLHDRLRYTLQDNGGWMRERLAP